ncbi:O-succinylbenzoic acid--CoA ligase [Actinomadura rubrobrunea]|uniref:O-succinylbenzoic acid--CoA ligase n=1 Tax=Actinomadura rubrobrunea TaxID=115335 RepID=A0A9W6Q2Q1_9ACTN|nr:AMP-binding protein [Actinomadura rubrobrunea]GLW67343.1 O-succinylbenzoic acid--CoA ligase [Actinomadura rubrobrunea]
MDSTPPAPPVPAGDRAGERPVHAVLLPPGERLFQALAAALDGTGPAICPLSPDLPAPALRTLLDALAPHAVETADGLRPRRGEHPAPVPVADGTAVLIATSGSTGTPKIVELSAAALRHSAAASLARIGARPGDRWLCCLPTSHIAGVQVLVRSLVAGTEPVILPGFDTAAFDAALAGGRARHTALVPTQLRRLLDAGVDLARLGVIVLGGAAASPALLDEARAHGARIVTTYGMSETCGGCVYDGVPLDGVRVAVGDDGRIRLAGPVLFTGYRLRPDLTAAARDGEWFVAPDLGVVEPDGRLRVRGRADDVINTGGEKVVAGEVAAVLARHPAVRDVVVVGRPDPEWGERVTAVVVPAGPPPTLDDLRAWVRAAMPAPAAPRELELVEAIPLLPSGKPDRQALRGAVS